MNLIECTDLRFGYPGQTTLACSDFTVGAGDYIHIAGPNGIGKTTLLRVLAGLLVPLSGRVVRARSLEFAFDEDFARVEGGRVRDFNTLSSLVATIARVRSLLPRPIEVLESAMAVDVDFAALNDTMRSVKIVELMIDPPAFKDKTIRVNGVAVYGEDEVGMKLYGLQVYDAGGCWPLLTLEYRPTSTNGLSPRGECAVLEGRFIVRSPLARPRVIITNSIIRVKKPATSIL